MSSPEAVRLQGEKNGIAASPIIGHRSRLILWFMAARTAAMNIDPARFK
jgi:hypothetical protein